MAARTESGFDKLAADAIAHHRAGRFDEAEVTYRAALRISPGHPAITHNLGVVAAAQGKHRSAINRFDEAIAAEPQYASAHFNRALALQALGRSREAQASGRTCAIEPAPCPANRAFGLLWLAQVDQVRSLDHFARTSEVRRGEDRTGMAIKSLTFATREKLLHGSRQFHYLSGRRRDRQRFEMLARLYADVARDFPDGAVRLSSEQLEILGEDYNTAINIAGAPELQGRAVSERPDHDAIMQRFKEHQAGAVFFDGLLTPPAFHALKQDLLESTIWHDFSHIGGFVASYLEDGLACPLMLQIADELRGTFPELLGQHPLSQAWAFKGLESRAAVNAHADDAAVSVNFWVTSDDANLTPDRGGLLVCRVPPPPQWEMTVYDADINQIVAFLEQNAVDTLTVPYRENRAVLFESRLFHRSDAPEFKSDYENHRINLTMLFGQHSR